MPEGPEVRRAADRVARVLLGCPTTKVRFAFPQLRKFEARLTGTPLTAATTRGKALLLEFGEAGLVVYVHLLLYGKWYVRSPPSVPNTRRSLRLEIATENACALLYSASEIAVVESDALDTIPYLAALGPDCLDATLTRAQLMRRLSDAKFARRRLASLYLDQAFVAGIGNYLRAEILFEAGLHGLMRPADLSTVERRRLAQATLVLSQRAYKQAGTTLPRERIRQLKAKQSKRRDYRHYVYARYGRPCHVCGTKVESIELSGRRLYYCPHCQPARPAPRR
jgi:endonuclease VIII